MFWGTGLFSVDISVVSLMCSTELFCHDQLMNTITPQRIRKTIATMAACLVAMSFASQPVQARPKPKPFTLSTPKKVTLSAGQSMNAIITTRRAAGFTAPVEYQIVGKIVGVTATVTATPIGASIALTSANTLVKMRQTVKILGTSGAIKQSTTLTLFTTKSTVASVQAASPTTPVAQTPAQTVPSTSAMTSIASTSLPPPTNPTTVPPAPQPAPPAPLPVTPAQTTTPPPTTAAPQATPPSTAATGDFSVAVLAKPFHLQRGSSVGFGAIESTGGYSGQPTVTISNLPPGVTFSSADKTTSRIEVGPTAAIGNTTLLVSATDGQRTRTGTWLLEVAAPYSLTLDATWLLPQVAPGGSINMNVDTVASDPRACPSIGVTKLPPGSTVTSNSIVCSVTRHVLTVKVPPDASEGEFLVTVTAGEGSGVRASITPPLTVSRKPYVIVLSPTVSAQRGGVVSVKAAYFPIPGITVPTFTFVSPLTGITGVVAPPDANNQVAITITVLPAVPTGNYPITVLAASGSAVTELKYTLTVT
jgi:hypothetical protein